MFHMEIQIYHDTDCLLYTQLRRNVGQKYSAGTVVDIHWASEVNNIDAGVTDSILEITVS